jgi:hypothetical protein
MSTFAGKAYHPINGATEEVWEGFSWPCLFFGFLWYLYKGMWGWSVFALVLAFATWGISWLVFPFFANGQYAKSLLERGYLNEKQWNDRQQGKARGITSGSQHTQTRPSIADELAKLATLKEQGVLSEDEFVMQKKKLLS